MASEVAVIEDSSGLGVARTSSMEGMPSIAMAAFIAVEPMVV